MAEYSVGMEKMLVNSYMQSKAVLMWKAYQYCDNLRSLRTAVHRIVLFSVMSVVVFFNFAFPTLSKNVLYEPNHVKNSTFDG
jgi:hypothetical protein